MLYWRLAWRYAARRLVNLIAVLALALALTVQIVALSAMEGMLVNLERRLRNMGEQITVKVNSRPPDATAFSSTAESLSDSLPGVAAVTPLIQKVGFIQAGGGAQYVWVHGIDLDKELAAGSLAAHLISYRPESENPSWYQITDQDQTRPGLYMGERLAASLGVAPGAEVELFFAQTDADGAYRIKSRRFLLTSLFRSGVFERDTYGIYIPITEAAEFYLGEQFDNAADLAETFVLWLDDPNQAEAMEEDATAIVRTRLEELGMENTELMSDTWLRRWAGAAQNLKYEITLMELILFLNNVASGFCVFAILVTLVSKRMRDIGLLRCIGISRRGVMTVFLLVGLIIGVAGGVLGTVAGCFLSGPLVSERHNGEWRLTSGSAVSSPLAATETEADRRSRIDSLYETVTGQPLFPGAAYRADGSGLPIAVYPRKVAVYFLAAVLIAVAAALYPAAWAAWREPMSALREG